MFTLLDMAGQGKPNHPIEQEGMRRSEELAQKADGILLVLDSSRKKDKEDRELLNKYKTKKTILVFNKCDLSQKMNIKNIITLAPKRPFCEVSALKKTNIQELKKTIYSKWVQTEKTEQEIILHLHQKLLLEDILKALEKGKEKFLKGFPEEIYAEEIKKSIPFINQLTGEICSDDIINSIFQRFCIGK